MCCAQKDILMEKYFSAVAEVVEAGKDSRVSTEEWKEATREARVKAESAMGRLDEHRRVHRC